MANTLFAQIEASSLIDDLDEAIRPIQEILGQDDGGPAGIFFSGPDGDRWSTATESDRAEVLRLYVEFELIR